MPQIEHFKNLALSFEEVIEETKSEKTTFKVEEKIFATLNTENYKAVIRLSTKDQNKYSDTDPSAIYPAPAGWGKQGWTIFELKFVDNDLVEEALKASYCEVAPEKLSAKYSAN